MSNQSSNLIFSSQRWSHKWVVLPNYEGFKNTKCLSQSITIHEQFKLHFYLILEEEEKVLFAKAISPSAFEI